MQQMETREHFNECFTLRSASQLPRTDYDPRVKAWMSNEGITDRSLFEPTISTSYHTYSSLTNHVSKYQKMDKHSRDISDCEPFELICPLMNIKSSHLAAFNVYNLRRNLAQETEHSRSEQTLPTEEYILPLKKRRSYLYGKSVTEPSEIFSRTDLEKDNLDCPFSHDLQMKHFESKLEFDEPLGDRSHEKHTADAVNSQEIPAHCYQSNPDSLNTTQEPLDLSVIDNRTTEHKNDQEPLQGHDPFLAGSDLVNFTDASQGFVRSDVEINVSQQDDQMQQDEQMQQDDSLSRQISIDNQQDSTEYPLINYSKHEAETDTTSVDFSDQVQKELEELESSIAIDSFLSTIAPHHSEPELKCGKLRGNDDEEIKSSCDENMSEKHINFSHQPLVDEKSSDSSKKGIDAQEEEEKGVVEKKRGEIEETSTEYVVEEETVEENSRVLQPVLRVKHLRRKKSRIAVDVCSSSFTRLPRSEQMRIDPVRASKLREENNLACKKNRLKKMQKLKELEKELAMLKELFPITSPVMAK